MYDLGWTGPVFFDDASDGLALRHAISRYHTFVSSVFSPTLSISIQILQLPGSHRFVVHLILRPSIGHRPCLAHINSRLLNTRLTVLHTWVVSLTSEYICSSYFLANISDDKVEGLQLSFAFDLTCRARKVNKSHSW